MIEILGFEIIYRGDPSVGIFPASWSLQGFFSFENEEDENMFVQKLLEAYEYAWDTPVYIRTVARRINHGDITDKIWNQ